MEDHIQSYGDIFFIISELDFQDFLNYSASGVILVSDKMKFCKWIRKSDILLKKTVIFFQPTKIYLKIEIVL